MRRTFLLRRMAGLMLLSAIYFVQVSFADDAFNNLIAGNRYKEAIDYAEEQIDVVNRTPAIWVQLGDAYDKIGMPEKSLACFLVSWRMNQNDYSSLIGAARAYNKLDNPEMAIDMAKKALDVDFTAEAGWEYAQACIALKRPAEAKKAMAKVIEGDTSNLIAVRELSNIYFSEGDWSRAVPLLKNLFRKNESGELAFQIGKAYTELCVPDSAIVYLVKARDGGGPAQAVSLMLARAYFGKKRWGDCWNAYKNVPAADLAAVDFYRYATAVENTRGLDEAYDIYSNAVERFGIAESGQEALFSREKVAKVKMTRGLFSDAATLLQQVISADPGGKIVVKSYCVLAEAYQGQNKTADAIAALEKAIEINSRNIEAYAQLADVYQKNGMAEKAQKTFEVMIGLSPGDPNIYIILGNYNIKSKRYKEALQQFEKSNALKNSAAAQQGIARAAYESKSADQALSAAEAALKLDPKLHDARLVFASIKFERQKYGEAQGEFEKLVQQEPDNLELLISLAKCYEKNQKTDLLYSTDKRIVQLKSDDTTSLLRLARYSASKNSFDEALGYYHQVLALTPQSAGVLHQVALLSRKNGAADDALIFTRRYLDINGNDAEAHRDCGDLLYEKNDLDGALYEYRTALKLDPAIKGFYKRYADIVMAKGEQDEVIRALKGVIVSGGADQGTYMTLGLVYQKQKEFIDAIEMFQNALRLDPSNFDALSALASCQAVNGEISNAIISYEQAVMMNPSSLAELKELGDLYAKEKRDEEALKVYLKYCEKDSGNASVTAKVGNYLFEKKDLQGAVRFFEMARQQLEPADAVRFASVCLATGKNKRAIQLLLPLKADRTVKGDLQRTVFRQIAVAFENDSDYVEASKAYGDYIGLRGVDDGDAAYKQAALLEKNDAVGAQKIFELNCKKYPSDYRNYLRLALLYSNRQDMLSKAIPLFTRVTELADSIPVVWLELGKVYRKTGNDDEELRAYRKYAESDPQSIEANRRIGTILLRKGQVSEGIVFLEIANTLQPGDPEIMELLAGGYVRTNRTDEAIAFLNKAKSKKTDDPDIRFQLFELYQKTGKKDKAQNEIEELVSINREPRYMALYVEALMVQGKMKEADAAIEELLAIDPENIKTLLLKGKVLRLQKLYDEAVEIYKEINVIDPADAVSLYERAETHLEQSKPQWAETFFRRALRADPSMARAELGLARIAKTRKDMALYHEHLENARKLGPDDDAIVEELKNAGSY